MSIVFYWIVQLSILAALRGRSPRKIFLLGKLFQLVWVVFYISGMRWHSPCSVTFTFLFHFHNSSFLLFYFFFDWLSLGTTRRLASGVVMEVFRVLGAYVFSSLAMSSVSKSFIKLSMSSSSAPSASSNKAYICSLLAFSSKWKYLFLPF